MGQHSKQLQSTQSDKSFTEKTNDYLKILEEIYALRKNNSYKFHKDEEDLESRLSDIFLSLSASEVPEFEKIIEKVPTYWYFLDVDKKLITASPIELFYDQNPVIFKKHIFKQYDGQKTYFGNKILMNRARLFMIIRNHIEGKPKLVIAMDTELKLIKKLNYQDMYKNIPVFMDNR
jgi:hypothetical protein